MRIKVDNRAAKALVSKLKKISEVHFPNAVKKALNDAAYDMKTKTMPDSSKKEFVNRTKSFFKALSRYEKASGNNVNTMKSIVGFMDKDLRGKNNYSVKDLDKQEEGGTIGGKALIPTNKARIGGSRNRMVRNKARITEVPEFKKVSEGSGKNEGQKFIKTAMFAGKGGIVLKKTKTGKEGAFLIKSITNKKGKINIKTEMLYSVKKGRKVKVKPTHFMAKANKATSKKIDGFFNKKFKSELNKL